MEYAPSQKCSEKELELEFELEFVRSCSERQDLFAFFWFHVLRQVRPDDESLPTC